MMEQMESGLLGNTPYGFEQRDRFFGRDEEIRALTERLRLRSLTVLQAGSGSGKTSLLMAGVYPRLLEERIAANIHRMRAGGKDDRGAAEGWPLPLVARRWSLYGATQNQGEGDSPVDSFTRVLYQLLRESTSRVADDLAVVAAASGEARRAATDDVAKIRQVLDILPAPERIRISDLRELIIRLDEAVGPVALVLDQLEEVLRSATTRDGIVRVLAAVRAQAPRNCHFLLSFRSDTPFDATRALEMALTITSSQASPLYPLKPDLARMAFERLIAAIPGADERREAISTLTDVFTVGSAVRLPELATACWYLASADAEQLSSLRKLLDRAGDSAGSRACRDEIASKVYGEWIESALRAGAWDNYGLKATMLADIADLLFDEVDGGTSVKTRITEGKLAERAYGRQLRERGIGRVPDFAIPREEGESEARARESHHAHAFRELLNGLVEKNVLVRSTTSDHAWYELVHDSSGNALRVWADEYLASVNSRLHTQQLVATWDWSGLGRDALVEAVKGVSVSRELRDIAWRQCVVGSAQRSSANGADEPRPRTYIGSIDHMSLTITDSQFARTVFENCDFGSVVFRRCDLGDVVFVGCTFKEVVFEGCILVGAEFRGSLDDSGPLSLLQNVRFHHCALRGAFFRRCSMSDGTEILTAACLAGDLVCAGVRDYVGAQYMIMEECELSGLRVGRPERCAGGGSFDWVGGALRGCTIAGQMVFDGVEYRAATIENPVFRAGSIRMHDSDATATVFLETVRSETENSEESGWELDIVDTKLTGSVFRGTRLRRLSVVREDADRYPDGLPCRGMVMRSHDCGADTAPLPTELREVNFADCDLMALTLEGCRYDTFVLKNCVLDRTGFYDVAPLADDTPPIQMQGCSLHAWQEKPKGWHQTHLVFNSFDGMRMVGDIASYD